MEKVQLNEKQIKMFKNHENNVKDLFFKYTCKNCPTYIDDLTLEEVLQCILGNYELEKTPEERLLEEFEKSGLHFVEWGDSKLENILNDYGFDVVVINILKNDNKRLYKIDE